MSAFKTDKQLVRDYVTAADHLQYTQLPEDVVAVHMTHSNLPSKHMDLRLNLHLTILDVKEKFRTHIGTPPEHQKLILKDQFGNKVCELADNSKMLGFYSPQSGMEIHIIDTDPYSLSRNGGLTDVSLVEKYKISDEDYDKRKGTMRDYIREQRKANPNFKLKAATINTTEDQEHQHVDPQSYGADTVEGIAIGNRCEVQPGARRGTVKFVGEIVLEEKSKGYWVGVQFDEPLGHNDGCFKGKKFFECAPGYGAFVRGNNMTVGDFPERDLLADDDEEDEI